MKKISLWGKKHKKLSVFIIVFAMIFLNTSFGVMGLWLEMENINIPITATYLLAIVLGVTALVYFYQQKNTFRSSPDSYSRTYAQRKTYDFIMFVATALFALCLVNQESASLTLKEKQENNAQNYQENPIFRYVSNDGTVEKGNKNTKLLPENAQKNLNTSFDDKKPSLSKIRKEMRKTIKKHIKAIKSKIKTTKTDTATKVFLTILGILLMPVILIAALGLSCELSCSGNGTAAVLVLLLGLGLEVGIVVLLVRLWRKEPEEEEEEASATKNKKKTI